MSWLKSALFFLPRLALLGFIAFSAYDIRMFAIRSYGLVIHEFDPWFNFRATEYLAQHGLSKFFQWYDYMSWYPLGRPVGTTIYPGMQMVSVFIWRVLNDVVGYKMSLNDVCCYVPVWFGVLATILLFLLTRVCTRSTNAALGAAFVMSIIPAHIMRSVGGGFDNESVAISCMVLTFLCWCYSLSGKDDNKVTYFGVFTGLAYTCMVAAWGGYIFVLNMIGIHALVLILIGRYTKKLHSAYSLWYIVGTLGAIQVPVVGLTPLKSLEQLFPACVFIFLQLIYVCEHPKVLAFFKVDAATLTYRQKANVYFKVFSVAGIALSVVVALLWPTGYFGPLSSRVRGLFVQHTRTGNPLVDSVAEHQPASPEAFWQFLHYACYLAPAGFVIAVFECVVKPFFKPRKNGEPSSDPLMFLVMYALVAYYFSTKMNRLILLMGAISSSLSGIAIGEAFDFVWNQASEVFGFFLASADKPIKESETVAAAAPSPPSAKPASGRPADSSSSKKAATKKAAGEPTMAQLIEAKVTDIGSTFFAKSFKKVFVAFIVYAALSYTTEFYKFCFQIAVGMSNPSLMFHARLHDGTMVTVDDYREAYWFLRDNTPEDARVMAWWDYGYQITGIGNRTTIADGNTWNHEHIALLGRCLTSPEKKAHDMVKHLADYVLIWTGGGGDDLAKSPHMARIGNSVFDDICPDDPLCRKFGFINQQMTPTPMMAASLLYKLHSNRMVPGVTVDPKLFREVFTSKYGKVRIYEVVGVSKKSKAWVADPANRVCDAPGSWLCRGQYPPALNKVLEKRKNFAQLEDFNVQKDEKARKYHEEYMKKMSQQGG
jgi:dolichyl-diphosphooligosaccharide--protein glycosyltransferase